MTPLVASRILKLSNGYTADDVRAAFVREVNVNFSNPHADMDQITKAKDTLLGNLAGEFACVQCNGVGYVRGRVGSVECSRCGGEGTV
jgi:hypothetical protein